MYSINFSSSRRLPRRMSERVCIHGGAAGGPTKYKPARERKSSVQPRAHTKILRLRRIIAGWRRERADRSRFFWLWFRFQIPYTTRPLRWNQDRVRLRIMKGSGGSLRMQGRLFDNDSFHEIRKFWLYEAFSIVCNVFVSTK